MKRSQTRKQKGGANNNNNWNQLSNNNNNNNNSFFDPMFNATFSQEYIHKLILYMKTCNLGALEQLFQDETLDLDLTYEYLHVHEEDQNEEQDVFYIGTPIGFLASINLFRFPNEDNQVLSDLDTYKVLDLFLQHSGQRSYTDDTFEVISPARNENVFFNHVYSALSMFILAGKNACVSRLVQENERAQGPLDEATARLIIHQADVLQEFTDYQQNDRSIRAWETVFLKHKGQMEKVLNNVQKFAVRPRKQKVLQHLLHRHKLKNVHSELGLLPPVPTFGFPGGQNYRQALAHFQRQTQTQTAGKHKHKRKTRK